jgi:hypothetical protein
MRREQSGMYDERYVEGDELGAREEVEEVDE